ncbi:MAG: multidrug effflux MFS transporter [Zoogloeaceae bacterium]|jgi:DHA1 family bicyclomycin/chloramphenicol resistance-like MFS transporter|nr:multidrug effflux MFS transporter [Zoogloeaceae bacterium]
MTQQKTAAPTLALTVLLAGLAAVGPFSIDTYLPAFPEMTESLQTDVLRVQQTLSIYLLTFGLMTLWHGALSDSFGRRRVILAGVAVYALTSLGCTLAPNIETLWVMRGLQGLSAGAGMVVSRAMVRDLYEGPTAQRLMSQVAIMFAIAPAIAPIIGGWLLAWGHWRAIFAFLALASLALFIVCRKMLPESLPREKRQPFALKPLFSGYRTVMGNLSFLAVSLGIGIFFSGYFVYILSAPMFVREHLELSVTQFYWLFVPGMCGMVAGSWLCGRVAGRWNDKRALCVAFGVMLFAAALNLAISRWFVFVPSETRLFAPLPLSQHTFSLLVVVLPLAFYNLGVALSIPICTLWALDLFPEARRGTAASCQSFLQTLVNTLVSAFVVHRIWHSRMGLAWSMIVMGALGAAMVLASVFSASRLRGWQQPS